MSIKDHGMWTRYKPATPPKEAPSNAMFVRRASDGMDWYEYVHSGKNFGENTIKLTVHDGAVGAATLEADRLFPSNARVLEIIGETPPGDLQEAYGRKLYDAAKQTFREPPAPKPPPGMEDLLKRLEALENKKGP